VQERGRGFLSVLGCLDLYLQLLHAQQCEKSAAGCRMLLLQQIVQTHVQVCVCVAGDHCRAGVHCFSRRRLLRWRRLSRLLRGRRAATSRSWSSTSKRWVYTDRVHSSRWVWCVSVCLCGGRRAAGAGAQSRQGVLGVQFISLPCANCRNCLSTHLTGGSGVQAEPPRGSKHADRCPVTSQPPLTSSLPSLSLTHPIQAEVEFKQNDRAVQNMLTAVLLLSASLLPPNCLPLSLPFHNYRLKWSSSRTTARCKTC
jgi:hypothetical protein